MPGKKKQGNLLMFAYTISDEQDFLNRYFHISEQALKSLRLYHAYVQKNPAGAVTGLIELVQKYPDIPQFKNLLATAYQLSGNLKKANDVNEWIISEHPDYLFGKLNKAYRYLAERQPEKIEKLLGRLMEIKALYPERNIFHSTEIIAFYKVACLHFLAINNMEAAKSRLQIMKTIDSNHPDVTFIRHQMKFADLANHPEKLFQSQKRKGKK
jgi:tetratricopeptide (TPR) repeat protein